MKGSPGRRVVSMPVRLLGLSGRGCLCPTSPRKSGREGLGVWSRVFCCSADFAILSIPHPVPISRLHGLLLPNPTAPVHPPLPPARLWGGLPPWRPHRAALHWGGQETPASGWAGEQRSAQGEGKEAETTWAQPAGAWNGPGDGKNGSATSRAPLVSLDLGQE